MKKLTILTVLSFLLFSCNWDSKKKEKQGLAIAKLYMQAVEKGNIKTMDSLLATDYVGYGPSVGDSVNKTTALAGWKYNTENLYESIKYTRFQNIAVRVEEGQQAEAGDWVCNWAYLTIKYKDRKEPVHLWVNATYKIENGKIVRSRTFYNEADVLRQLGYKIEL